VNDIRHRIRKDGRAPVIITLRQRGPSAEVPQRQSTASEQAIAAIQERVIQHVLAATGSHRRDLGIKRFRYSPALAMQITEGELDALLSEPAVVTIQLDSPTPPTGADAR
jgi:hypothetical protein